MPFEKDTIDNVSPPIIREVDTLAIISLVHVIFGPLVLFCVANNSECKMSVKIGRAESKDEAFGIISSTHYGANSDNIKVVYCDSDLPDGGRSVTDVLLSSLGVGAVIECEVPSKSSGSKRSAPITVCYYAFYTK